MPTTDAQTKQPGSGAARPYKGLAMEGLIASWYTKIRQNDQGRAGLLDKISAVLPAGSRVLEVAPGPGYLSIELAKHGYQVVGMDISASFVQIARAKAKESGVAVDFQRGNASEMPFDGDAFDFIVCCAAFKNFTEPVRALQEMHRVLKLGGTALIVDLRRDASPEEIAVEIQGMGLNAINSWLTKQTFTHFLLKNAYTREEIRRMVTQTKFTRLDIRDDPIGMDIWLKK
jgi:ubiquinone/menaquinone biosynthesis C-methylase UbiE